MHQQTNDVIALFTVQRVLLHGVGNVSLTVIEQQQRGMVELLVVLNQRRISKHIPHAVVVVT